jgi:hypothetical protein
LELMSFLGFPLVANGYTVIILPHHSCVVTGPVTLSFRTMHFHRSLDSGSEIFLMYD